MAIFRSRLSLILFVAFPFASATFASEATSENNQPPFRAAWRYDDAHVIMPMETVMDGSVESYHLAALPKLTSAQAVKTTFDHAYRRARLSQLPVVAQNALLKEPVRVPWTLFLGGDVRVSATRGEILLPDGSDFCGDQPFFVLLRVADGDLAAYRAAKEKYYLALPATEAAKIGRTSGAGRWVMNFKMDAAQEERFKTALGGALRASLRKELSGGIDEPARTEHIGEGDPRWAKLSAADAKILAGGGTLLYDVQAFTGKSGDPPRFWARGKLREGGYDRILGSYWVTPRPDGSYQLEEDACDLGDGYYTEGKNGNFVSTEKLGLVFNAFSLGDNGEIGLFEFGYYYEGEYFLLPVLGSGAEVGRVNLYAEGC